MTAFLEAGQARRYLTNPDPSISARIITTKITAGGRLLGVVLA